MKLNPFATGLLGTFVITLGLNLPINQVNANTDTEFICAESFDRDSGGSLPTTFAWTPRGKIAVIRWETEYFSASSYTPVQRCQAVSPRFQKAYENNNLGIITNGQMNNQPVICTAKEPGGVCANLLMTLRPEDNSLKILDQFRQIFNGEQVGPVKHNASTPQVYYKIDIENFLRNAPVE